MHINIEFLIVAYFISLFVDWIFQWDWQAVNKSKWVEGNRVNAFFAVVTHSLIYATLIGFILYVFPFKLVPSNTYDLVWYTLFLSHIIIDTRIPVKWIMRFKGMSWKQINDTQNFGFMHIGIDHRLHEIVLVILAMLV